MRKKQIDLKNNEQHLQIFSQVNGFVTLETITIIQDQNF